MTLEQRFAAGDADARAVLCDLAIEHDDQGLTALTHDSTLAEYAVDPLLSYGNGEGYGHTGGGGGIGCPGGMSAGRWAGNGWGIGGHNGGVWGTDLIPFWVNPYDIGHDSDTVMNRSGGHLGVERVRLRQAMTMSRVARQHHQLDQRYSEGAELLPWRHDIVGGEQ